MANESAGQPWVLDSTGLVTASNVYIKTIYWTPGSNSDDLIIHDNSGRVILDVDASSGIAADPLPYGFSIHSYVQGFVVNTIDGGTIYVYHGKTA